MDEKPHSNIVPIIVTIIIILVLLFSFFILNKGRDDLSIEPDDEPTFTPIPSPSVSETNNIAI